MSAQDELDAIKARLQGATPGPWELSDAGGPSGGMVIALAGRGRLVADMARDTDADLIAHAPTDLAAMHAALTVVRDANDRYMRGEISGTALSIDIHTAVEAAFQPKVDRS